ncbi:MAG: serine/threonine protein kinase [Deltaproteobacteria bacterium]|nr:serine/threonine protein kinase [Deltaproteobacteria bacterium]
MSDTFEIDVEDPFTAATLNVPILVGSPLGASKPDPKRTHAALDPSTAPKIGDYQIIARFASSDQAQVFLAQRSRPGREPERVVLKLAPRHGHDFQGARTKLLDELGAMLLLQHPNIISVVEANEAPEGFFVVIEYVDGVDVASVLDRLAQRKVRMPVELSAFTVKEVLKGLDHAHQATDGGQPLHLIHRDANPSNVLLSRRGEVKLADFGIARIRGRLQSATLPGVVKGKVSYLAPEYLAGKQIDHRIDIYSVGVMLYELLTGIKAFPGKSMAASFKAIVHDGLSLDPLDAISLPEGIKPILARAIDRNPELRYSFAHEMVSKLETWSNGLGVRVGSDDLAAYLKEQRLVTGDSLEG